MATVKYVNGLAQPNAYRAVLFQELTDAPIANVGENTLPANVVWSRFSSGLYYLTADQPIFLEGKTFVNLQQVFTTVSYGRTSDTQVFIQENNSVDDWLLFHMFEVLVYP